MKTSFWLLALAAIVAGCSSSGQVYQSEDGKFSYALPSGWELKDFPGMPYKIAFGSGEGAFTANLHVVSQEFDGPLEVYVEGSRTTIEGMFPDFQVVGQGLFDTASGIHGFKLAGQASQMGIPLKQAWYFLPGKGEYFVFTASALQTDFDAQEAAFDACVKSFRLR